MARLVDRIATFPTLALLVFATHSPAQEGRAKPQRKPNIVLLYADDAGYADFGFQKQPAKDMASLTPHIDSIAKKGVHFTK